MIEENKIEYDLIKLTVEELKEAISNKDKCEIDLLNAEGKLEIQKFKIEYEIPKLELNGDVEKIEDSIKDIKKHLKKLDEKDPRYYEKVICHEYDIFCGGKSLELSKLKAKKNMGSRIANEAIKVLEGRIQFCKDNLKVFKDQIRNKVKKVPKQLEHIQLDEDGENKGTE